MRRGFSIVLILFFGLGPLSAFVDGSEDTGLPACCRRHGQHHCAMSAEMMAMRARLAGDPTQRFEAPPTCPLYHGPSFSMLMPAHALAAAPPKIKAAFTPATAPVLDRIAAFSAPGNTYSGRGPPTAALS